MNILVEVERPEAASGPEPARSRNGVGRRILWASLGLTPVVLAVHYFTDAAEVARLRARGDRARSARVADRRGDRARRRAHRAGHQRLPQRELRQRAGADHRALAIRHGLPDIVRGSIAGSIVSNLLLVLGLTMIAGQGPLDRRSLLLQLAIVLVAVSCSWSRRCRAGTATPNGTRSSSSPSRSRPC